MQSAFRLLALACLWAACLSSASASNSGPSASEALDRLLRRDLTCANSSLNSCSSVDSKLPGNFCCSANHNCISLDSSSSALCCPAGITCAQIKPISCNIAQQNPITNPGAGIQTTKLTQNLPVCGNLCCPFGYTCSSQGTGANETNFCTLDKATSIVGGTSSAVSSASSTPTASSTASSTSSTSTSTATASGIDSNKTLPTGRCQKFPGAAVAVGFVPGLLAGALLTLVALLLFFKSPESRPNSQTSSIYKSHYPSRDIHGNITGVSEPIPHESQSARTDFLSRTTTKAKSIFGSRNSQDDLPYQENWKMPTPPVQSNIPMQPVGGLIPVTPHRQQEENRYVTKQPSTESIRVYSPQGVSRPDPSMPPAPTGESQRYQPQQTVIGSPFKTPPNNKYTYPDDDVPDRGETLTPARYNDGKRREDERRGEANTRDSGRPLTSFTQMLHSIDFPDPGRDQIPAVPMVPRGLNVSRKGREI